MKNLLKQFRDDENGAAMVEYTILLGLIAAATIATIVLVAAWISGTWANLCNTLGTNSPVGCTAPATGG